MTTLTGWKNKFPMDKTIHPTLNVTHKSGIFVALPELVVTSTIQVGI